MKSFVESTWYKFNVAIAEWRVTYALEASTEQKHQNARNLRAAGKARAARARSSNRLLQCARLLGQGFKAQYSLI
jgi:hypothetical protein